jgi:hypothetical protein
MRREDEYFSSATMKGAMIGSDLRTKTDPTQLLRFITPLPGKTIRQLLRDAAGLDVVYSK